MRLKPLFLTFAVLAPLSLVPAQAADGVAPAPAPAPPTAAMPHDESLPHVHDEKAPEDETPTDYFWRKSDEAFHAGDYPRAIGLHRAIIALDPTAVESYSLGAWLSWSLGNKDDADKFLNDGLKANPQDPEMWDAAGQQYDLQKRYAESANALGKAVTLSGKDADQMLRRRYAHAAQHAGDWATSEQVWSGLVADFPNDPVNKNNLARVVRERAAAGPGTGPAVAVVGAAVLLGALALLPRVKREA